MHSAPSGTACVMASCIPSADAILSNAEACRSQQNTGPLGQCAVLVAGNSFISSSKNPQMVGAGQLASPAVRSSVRLYAVLESTCMCPQQFYNFTVVQQSSTCAATPTSQDSALGFPFSNSSSWVILLNYTNIYTTPATIFHNVDNASKPPKIQRAVISKQNYLLITLGTFSKH